jgi:hypothetical protein
MQGSMLGAISYMGGGENDQLTRSRKSMSLWASGLWKLLLRITWEREVNRDETSEGHSLEELLVEQTFVKD